MNLVSSSSSFSSSFFKEPLSLSLPPHAFSLSHLVEGSEAALPGAERAVLFRIHHHEVVDSRGDLVLGEEAPRGRLEPRRRLGDGY